VRQALPLNIVQRTRQPFGDTEVEALFAAPADIDANVNTIANRRRMF
jgi:hypothetical protein